MRRKRRQLPQILLPAPVRRDHRHMVLQRQPSRPASRLITQSRRCRRADRSLDR
jgi:hypothetical protein